MTLWWAESSEAAVCDSMVGGVSEAAVCDSMVGGVLRGC